MTLYASDVMIKDVISVRESTPLKEVARMFVERLDTSVKARLQQMKIALTA